MHKNKQVMHICMVAYSLYMSDARIRREAETLADVTGYKVSVLALRKSDSPRTYTVSGVEVRELNTGKYVGKSILRYLISYLRFLVQAFAACTGLLLRRRIDVVHVHNMPNFLVFAAVVPLFLRKKVILDIHDTVLETYASKFHGIANRIARRVLWIEEHVSCLMAHKIICVNHVQRDTLIRRGIPPEKLIISINVPDPRWFNPATNGNGGNNDTGKFKLVYHGTLAKRLGIDMTIQAVAKLKEKIPGLEFHVIGDGDDREEFMRLSDKLDVTNQVHFLKSHPIEDIVKLLEGMTLGVIANRNNCATMLMLPVKMLEYVALGIPVVVPRLQTIQYYFTEDMVGYFEPENVESLADAILQSFQDEDLRMKRSEKARNFLKKWGWETHKFDLLNLYRSFV